MAHPICGKCHSAGVYKDYDADGQTVIACFICGNRYPGGKEGFYMSGKTDQPKEKRKDETAATSPVGSAAILLSPRKLCVTCREKPTISDSCPYCASCMGRKGNEKRRQAATTGQGKEKHKTMEGKGHTEKSSPRPNMTVSIDFDKYPHVLKQVGDLADQEIRPLDLQIIYLLKHHLDAIKASL